jgi:hypothetical protein
MWSIGIDDPLVLALDYSEMLLGARLCRFQSALRVSSQKSDALLQKKIVHRFNTNTIQQGKVNAPLQFNIVRDLVRRVTAPSACWDTRLRAAMDLSMILATYHGSEAEALMIMSIEQSASKILSILSTTSVASLAAEDPKIVQSLCRLAISPHFRTKMAKRRCTLLALTRHLSHQDGITRESVFLVTKQLCVDDDCRACLYRGASENVDILREGLVEAAWANTSPEFQLILVSALQGIVQVMERATDDILDVFESYAYSCTSDTVTIESAVNLSKSVTPQLESIDKYLWVIADFITFPFPEVRREALKTLDVITTSTDGIMSLLTTTELVENASLVVKRGSREDRTNILNIMRQIARASLYHENLLTDPDFLSCIVDVVLADQAENESSAKGYATEILLSLLSNEENMDAFNSFRRLLPWLADIVVQSVFVDEKSKQNMTAIMAKISG